MRDRASDFFGAFQGRFAPLSWVKGVANGADRRGVQPARARLPDGAGPVPGDGVFQAVVAPEQLVADGEGRRAEDAERVGFVGGGAAARSHRPGRRRPAPVTRYGDSGGGEIVQARYAARLRLPYRVTRAAISGASSNGFTSCCHHTSQRMVRP